MELMKCSVCGSNNFTEITGRYQFQCSDCGKSYTANQVKKLVISREEYEQQQARLKLISSQIDDWIQSQDNTLPPIKKKFVVSTNPLSSVDIQKYLLGLITVEKDIYIIAERLKQLNGIKEYKAHSLAVKKKDLRLKLSKQKREQARLEKIETQCCIWLAQSAWLDAEQGILSYDDVKIVLPIPPTKPIQPEKPVQPEKETVRIPVEPVEPAKPLLQKAGMFNKRKVQEANNALFSQYYKAMESYRREKSIYDDAVLRASEAERAYTLHFKQYQEAEREYQEKMKEYHESLLQYPSAIDDYNAECRRLIEQKRDELEKELNARLIQNKQEQKLIDEAISLKLINSEIKQAQNLMIKLLKGRRDLYSCDIIFGKYHDIVALSSFYEYFMSGRCDTLTGPNGAYNLYEAEIRANQIISQLADVVNSLEQIKKNQYMIYTQLDSANQELQQLNGKMSSMLSSLSSLEAGQKTANRQLSSMNRELNSIKKATSSISSDTAAISRNTDAIAGSNEVIAYNTAAAAFYAKKNAELTNALGFLVALK